MQTYLDLLDDIITNGTLKSDRTGTGTLSTFGNMISYDLTNHKLPLLTTKQIFHKSFIHETLWFLSGSTNVKYLKENNVSIWNSWVIPSTAQYDSNGNLTSGSIGKGAYGAMWRNWEDTRIIPSHELAAYTEKGYRTQGQLQPTYGRLDVNTGVISAGYISTGVTTLPPTNNLSPMVTVLDYVVTRKIDQIANAIHLLKTNPDSRRIVVSAWNPALIEETSLPPCHALFQFYSTKKSKHTLWTTISTNGYLAEFFQLHPTAEERNSEDAYESFLTYKGLPTRDLSCMLYQRSCDFPVGQCFNSAQYALLTHMIAQVVNMDAVKFIWVGADTHVYLDQVELAKLQLTREPTPQTATVHLNPNIKSIDDFTFTDITILGYNDFYPAIKYPVAV